VLPSVPVKQFFEFVKVKESVAIEVSTLEEFISRGLACFLVEHRVTAFPDVLHDIST